MENNKLNMPWFESLTFDPETEEYYELTPQDDFLRWKPINGEPDYMISNYGDVRHNGYLLAPRKGDRRGHEAINISRNGKRHYIYTHRAMMESFEPNENSKELIVRHLDDNPNNNTLENLRWGTMKDNHADAVLNGRYRPFTDEGREKSYAKSRKPVMAIHIVTGEQLYYRSLNDACRDLGLQQSNAWKTLSKERRHTRGWTFEYT